MEHVQSELKLLQQQDQQDLHLLPGPMQQQQQPGGRDNKPASQELQHPQKQPTSPPEHLLQEQQQQQQANGSPGAPIPTPLEVSSVLPSRQNSGDPQQLHLQRDESVSPERSATTATGEGEPNQVTGEEGEEAGAEEEEEHEDDDPHQHEVSCGYWSCCI